MAATWDTVERKSNPKGVATLTIGDRKVKIEFADKSISKEFQKDDLPDEPSFIHKLPKGTKIELFVVLSDDRQEIQRFGPERGRVKVRCIDFVRPEKDSDPVPKTYEGSEKYKKEGVDNTYKAFTAMLEVTEGKWKDSTIPCFMHYKFGDNGKGQAAFFGNEEKSKNLRTLKKFMEMSGATKKPLSWPDDGNILPDLLKVIRRADAVFEVQILNGYVESILMDDADDDLGLDDADEVFPPVKKAAKKSKK